MPLALLRTERILLRPWTREDVDALHELWTAPDVRRYLWDDAVITRNLAAKVVESHLATAAKHRIGYSLFTYRRLDPRTRQLGASADFASSTMVRGLT
jgi:RimJ/RimL family protein N-acetyltransferase